MAGKNTNKLLSGQATISSKSYAYSAKEIYYSTLPYAATYHKSAVTGYDPTKTKPETSYGAISRSVISNYQPSMTKAQIQTVIAFEQAKKSVPDFRIVDVPYQASDGTEMVPVVQVFSAPYRDLDDYDHDGKWTTEATVRNVLLAQENGSGKIFESNPEAQQVELVGPQYAFPDDDAAMLSSNYYGIDNTTRIIKRVGQFVMLSSRLKSGIFYAKASDLITLNTNKPTVIDGIPYVTSMPLAPASPNHYVDTASGKALKAAGYTKVRTLFDDSMNEYRLKNGVWTDSLFASFETKIFSPDFDYRHVYFNVSDTDEGKIKSNKVITLNEGNNDFKKLLMAPTETLLGK
ncbi:hypothetical protein LOSG293_350010 [Secundilactobacillus oryzae JCM 18671]|uniref:Uncharacterized protein n=2 Tax=Secundilactobacillus oryzae TaxID=1202668 RepID=A0A081BKE5_9LACO|nr:hypothetical protein LOSG293_350010 [Secundilactobacillus oryzae JCM 18671]